MPVKNDLRREIVTIMSMRQEQVLFFKADENLSYGGVAEVLSDLKQDDPKLFIALVTKDQIGSVDGTQWRRANRCLP
jgi:biopolymer transport protein ExbD